MKKQTFLYGTILALAGLVYWKFGIKNKQKSEANGASGSSGTNSGSTSTPDKGNYVDPKPDCTDFTIYRNNQKQDYKWNNGKPTITYVVLPAYPVNNMSADGRIELTVLPVKPILTAGVSKPITKPVSTDDFKTACRLFKTGSYSSPNTAGGIPNTGGYKPQKPVLSDPSGKGFEEIRFVNDDPRYPSGVTLGDFSQKN